MNELACNVDDSPYPWQAHQWSMLRQSAAASRLHHATLLAGPSGVGKRDFAIAMSRLLLCLNFPKVTQACGTCERCRLMEAGTHPDYNFLDWVDKASVISVDQIRKLSEQLSLTATYGPYRIAVINRADTMTIAAGNSLLKTLEDPPGSCVMFLLAERDAALPATIRSRCQRLAAPVPDEAASLQWLEQQGIGQAQVALEFARGAPLLAANYAAKRDLSAIASVREQWRNFIFADKSPAALATETAAQLNTRESLTLFMQWTADFAKNIEFSAADGRSPEEGARVERRFLSQTMQLLQQSLRLDNASLKTQTVLEGVLADIRIQRMRIRAENSA
ncbi:MAG: DNA polymerase III subunit delta' [Pseudomonadota bacterium]